MRSNNIHTFMWRKCKRLFLNDPKKILLYPIIRKAYPYSLVGYVNLAQVYDAVKEMNMTGREGAIVEMGSWKGGCGSFMAWAAKKTGKKRTIWLFDSFEGVPEFSEEDKEKARRKKLVIKEKGKTEQKGTGIFKASPEDVEKAANALGVLDSIRIIKGWFQDTVPTVKKDIGHIVILRLDADIYESTKYALDELFDQVVSGGLIIIDDYGGWAGCNKAVYDFFCSRGLDLPIYHYPYGGRAYFRKR